MLVASVCSLKCYQRRHCAFGDLAQADSQSVTSYIQTNLIWKPTACLDACSGQLGLTLLRSLRSGCLGRVSAKTASSAHYTQASQTHRQRRPIVICFFNLQAGKSIQEAQLSLRNRPTLDVFRLCAAFW